MSAARLTTAEARRLGLDVPTRSRTRPRTTRHEATGEYRTRCTTCGTVFTTMASEDRHLTSTGHARYAVAGVMPDEPGDADLSDAADLSTMDVARLTGVTYRQIDYWCRIGLIPGQPMNGTGSGHRRFWTTKQMERVRRLRAASELHNMSLSDLADHLANATAVG